MTMFVQRTPTATALPFDLAFLKSFLRVDFDDDDAIITNLGRTAAAEVEHSAALALLSQTITVTVDGGLRRSVFNLPIAPLIDPLSVAMTVDGLAFEDFAVIAGLRPALRFTNGKPCGVLVITYEAGFGDSAADQPEDVRNAIADQVAVLFDLRGTVDGKTNGMSNHMARVAARYRGVGL